MNNTASPPPVQLRKGGLWKPTQEGYPLVIRCLDGTVWVTEPSVGRDIVLAAAQEFVARRDGRLVAQALSDATISVTPQNRSIQTGQSGRHTNDGEI